MIEDLSHLPPPSISNTPFYLHLVSSIPSLRLSIKDAVTASTKSWLFDIRESSALVGKLALEQMGARIKKWRAKREKEGGIRLARIGGALELVYNERSECRLGRKMRKLTSSQRPRQRPDQDRFSATVPVCPHLRGARLQIRAAEELPGGSQGGYAVESLLTPVRPRRTSSWHLARPQHQTRS